MRSPLKDHAGGLTVDIEVEDVADLPCRQDCMKTATATVDITPPLGGLLLGCTAPSTGVHDPLQARALVIEADGPAVVLISLDLIGLAAELSAAMRAAVAHRCGLAPERVVLLCSHTHSAPFTIPWSTAGWRYCRQHEQAWFATVCNRVAEATAAALNGAVDSRLSWARTAVSVGANRRLGGTTPGSEAAMQANPDGPVVPWSDVLRVDTMSGAPRAVVFSAAAHPVMIHRASTLISADYPGYAGKRIRERLGAAVVPLFAMGCGADSNAPLAVGFEACERMGRRLGDAVAAAAEHAQPVTSTRVHFATSRFALPLRASAPEAVLEQTITGLAARQPEELPEGFWANELRRNCQDLLERVRGGTQPQDMAMEVEVLAFGRELAVVALAHEVFAEYQQAIVAASPFARTVVWAYCNQCENYIPTAAEIDRGGYEVRNGPLFYRHRAGPAAEAEPIILGQVAAMLDSAWQAG